MNISLDLTPDLEQRLLEQAACAGLTPQNCVIKMLERQLGEKSLTKLSETELLVEATRGLEESRWKRYHELVSLRQNEQLTPQLHDELKQLTGDVEAAHARKLEFVSELARRQGSSLPEVMKELGLGQIDG